MQSSRPKFLSSDSTDIKFIYPIGQKVSKHLLIPCMDEQPSSQYPSTDCTHSCAVPTLSYQYSFSILSPSLCKVELFSAKIAHVNLMELTNRSYPEHKRVESRFSGVPPENVGGFEGRIFYLNL